MGKVKSAVITSLIVAAVLVLTLFATISFPTSNVKRYNSFISTIVMGSELTGDSYAVLYPAGVISSSDYNVVVGDSENIEEKNEYEGKYTPCGGVYVENEKLEDKDAFKASVLKDAEIISARFADKGYSGYSVTVVDDYSIKVTVPSNMSYAALKEYDVSARSAALTEIGHAVQYLTLEGEMSLRDSETATTSMLGVNEDFSSYFRKISMYSMAGSHAVKFDLTDEGFDKLNKIVSAGSEGSNAYIFVGETTLGMQIALGTPLTEKSMFYQLDRAYAQDFSILLSSVHSGNVLENKYNDAKSSTDMKLISVTPVFGEYAAVYLGVVVLLAIIASVVASVLKYKKLGLINALTVVIYSLAMVCALNIIGIQLTLAGAFIALAGLALITFTNFYVFEAIRKETFTGRTFQASVKDGYKKTLMSVLDLHIVLVVIAAMLALIGFGELAACGLIFFIAVIASYTLYWFTRFMWFVTVSPVKDKFGFCGYTREVYGDED